MPSIRILLLAGILAALTGVVLGAFGAHALANSLSAEQLATYETAVRYQMYHAFGILVGATLARQYGGASFRVAATLMVVGIVLFSGSLYLYIGTEAPGFAVITPVGGLFFISAWLLLAVGVFRHVKPS